jgi:hypothetical protein
MTARMADPIPTANTNLAGFGATYPLLASDPSTGPGTRILEGLIEERCELVHTSHWLSHTQRRDTSACACSHTHR